MIPLKLELKNFLSYGENVQTIDFSKHSLICFSGKNGNGKSAILDALTWAVWGQARKISGTIKPDAGLLRLGQTQMMVSVEFEFSRAIYRIKREFAKTYGKPYLALNLELFSAEQNKFISLTDKTVKLTQEKIEKLLGLDYETFVNSAFLRQGQANEFSQKTPKERKQILTNILGLSFYDELQKSAQEQVRSFLDEKKILQTFQEQIELELAKEKDLNLLLDADKQALEKINQELKDLETQIVSLEKEKTTFFKLDHEYKILNSEQVGFKNKVNLKLEDFRKIVLQWKQIHYTSLHLPNLEVLEKEREAVLKKEKEFLTLQQKSLQFQEAILLKKEQYQKKVYEHKFVLDLIDQKEKQKKDTEKKLKETKAELEIVQKNLKERDVFTQKLEQIKAQFEKRRAFYQTLIQKGNWVKAELQALEQKKETMHKHDSPACPLCEQVLSVKRKQFLGQKFKKEAKFFESRLAKITELIKKLKEILLLQHEELNKILQTEDSYKRLALKEEELIRLCKQNSVELEGLEKSINELQKQEKILDQVVKQDVEIKALEKEKDALHYDKNAHAKLHEDITKIEQALKEQNFIKQELVEQKERRNKIQLIGNEIKELKRSITQILKKIVDLDFNPNVGIDLDSKNLVLKKTIEERLKQKEKFLQQVGSLENELKRIEKLKAEKEQKLLRLKTLDLEIEEFSQLSQAFGKDGIQALLIEDAIPQIEEEANNILAKLTDNQAQIFIESLRDLKSGGVRESLDIQISDTQGIRPYEMFSGGEAFRVDFALRIAISKLLARRAGTALQTLIIDEGFGSQDDEGLARLMDAIYAIGNDFSKIIVVSHLTNFKDNFPVHFIVEKQASGSFVRVEERG